MGDDARLKLYLAHRGALVDYATPIVGDRTRAEDVVQDAFLRFARPSERSAAAIEQPLSYLYRVVRNVALDAMRRRRMEARHQDGDPLPWLVPAEPATPELLAMRRQDLACVDAALAELPRATRLAVEMHRIGGYTLHEIADRLGLSPTGAHRLVRDGLVAVARRLAARNS